MKTLFAPVRLPLAADVAMLITRLAYGYAFILAGWGKIQDPLHWMGPDAAYPAFLQALAAISEFGGGIFLILGLFSRLAAFGLVCTMLVAIYEHKFTMGDPYINMSGGSSYQVAGSYLLIALLLLTLGAGRFSLDRLLFGVKNVNT